MSGFRGHDISDWSHYKTPRSCPDFFVDRSHPGDKLVFKVALLAAAVLVLLVALGAV